MCIYRPMPHTLSYCALIGKCALIRSNSVDIFLERGLEFTQMQINCENSLRFRANTSYKLLSKVNLV